MLSCLAVIGLNKAIFSSFKKISTKNILYSILIVYVCSFFLSLILYFFYSLPKIVINYKKDIHEKVDIKEESKINVINNDQNKSNITYTKINIENPILNDNLEKLFENKLEEIKEVEKTDSNNDSQLLIKNQDFRRACTCCGYVYFSKKVDKKNVCICHKYNSCNSWFISKIIKIEIFLPLLFEIFMQLGSVGYFSVLSDKLLEEYSNSKIKKFYLNLFLIILCFTIYILLIKISYANYELDDDESKKDDPNNNDSKNQKKRNYTFIVLTFLLISYLIGFSIGILVVSILYICKDNHTGKTWDERFLNSPILIKSLDLQMLSFFDFFDDEDCLNTSLFITLEKLIWMIIEVILDIFEIKKNNLFIIQLVASGLSFIFLVFIAIFFIIDIKHFNKKENI